MEPPSAKCLTTLLLFVFFALNIEGIHTEETSKSMILEWSSRGRLGGNASLSCTVKPGEVEVSWLYKGQPVVTNGTKYTTHSVNISIGADQDGNRRMIRNATLEIQRTDWRDHGQYTCAASLGDAAQQQTMDLDLSLPMSLAKKTPSPVRVNMGKTLTLDCTFEGFNLTKVTWRKLSDLSYHFPANTWHSEKINETHVNGSLSFPDISRKDNDTYLCTVKSPLTNIRINSSIDLLVLDKPQVSIDFVKAVGAHEIYLNWTFNDHNSPMEQYSLQLRKNGSETWTYYSTPIGGRNVSYVIGGLDPLTSYQLKITAKNGLGSSQPYTDPRWVKTLAIDPNFIPDIMVKGFTMSSVSIGWSAPPEELSEYVHYYELMAREEDPSNAESKADGSKEKWAIHSRDAKNLPYMFDNLMPFSLYKFKVRSCSELTKKCGSWSPEVNGTTLDGLSGPVADPSLVCRHDNVSGNSFVYITWQPPLSPNGKIDRYNVEISGVASFVNSEGMVESANWGPKSRDVKPNIFSARFDSLPANTNFTITVAAVTRTKRPGEKVTMHCGTPRSAPSREYLQGFHWDKVREYDGRWMFRLYLPRITERNGAICCYRVFLVRMRNSQKLSDMPSPEHLAISSYKDVHNGKESAGAYIAEMFTSSSLHTSVILGDGQSTLNLRSSDPAIRQCGSCINALPPRLVVTTSTSTTTTPAPVVTTTAAPPMVKDVPADGDAKTTIKPVIVSYTELPDRNPTTVPDEEEEEEDTTATSDKAEDKKKKKKKTKRHFPTPISKLHKSDSLEGYQSMEPSNEKSPKSFKTRDYYPYSRESHSSFNDEQKFILDDEFYMNRRIIHQNKVKDVLYATTINDGSDDVKDFDEGDSVWNNNDEEDTEFDNEAETRDLYNNRLNNEKIENEFIGKHKLISRDIQDSLFIDKLRPKRQTAEENTNHDVSHRDGKSWSDSPVLFNSARGKEFYERAKIMQEKSIATEEVVDLSKMADGPDVASGPNPVMNMVFGDNNVIDGPLDISSNYTGFVELLVSSETSDAMMPVYSSYFSVLNPGPDDMPVEDNFMLTAILMIAAGGFCVILLLICIICIIHAQSKRKARNNGIEMHTLQTTIRNLYQGLKGGRHQLVSHSPPDIPPIPKDELLNAYNERNNHSGFGFQNEFELLPDGFPDRTMEASEAKENQGKNRYPDIKAYDQTRVRLSQIDSVLGSDYINANFVLGYKERKKFICAQGPTDVTVEDFWRLIWEQSVELVVMLTNLEEYSKVKCAKYWPDQQQPVATYSTIHVQHVAEKRYSDYIIRELKISKHAMTHSNSNNQIIELNGVKKNGVNECANGNGTAPGANEERIVKQYHFLMWKDFVAPEHPHAILKFIKRVNEACGSGGSTLVHCSAGVGRTGTLVALDCLLQQLTHEGHVAVFNTVCDLRRQRNFLVQSLKQYVFVYRALLEFAQFGDTEIPAGRLKTAVDRLRQTADNSDTCSMEDEFEKIKQPLLETPKPCSAGRAPEHLNKNRNESVLPYDHNRVILAPLPTREHATYINASFIQGYDNAESYIITQDPLPSTIADFWRMVSEQEISTIVMLSELGDGEKKCPRYWDDDEITYEHINVSYLQSESCPYYTRREFQVTNTKNQERTRVTQLQYHGWPTVSGQVPEVTRGLIELVGQSGASPPVSPPLLVHCNYGTDRSSMFVALSILITQLRTERRIDVSTVTRKLRSQRMGCLDTFLQYEFLHRAIVNYAELHNLLSDS